VNSLNAAIRVFFLGAALSGLVHANVIFDRGLPNSTNVNGAPATRSNEAWLTGFTSSGNYQLVGDNFTPTINGTISSITVFEVANNTNVALATPTQEFASVTLYEGTAAAATTTGISAVSSSYSFARVFYQPGSVNFIDQTATAFPIYSLTFSGLNIPVTSGTVYDFAVDATSAAAGACAASPFGDPCFLALHGTDAALAGTTQQGSDNQFINFILAGGKATVQGTCNAACQASTASVPSMAPTDINIQVTVVPEPGTWGALAGGLAGLMLVARKRRRATK